MDFSKIRSLIDIKVVHRTSKVAPEDKARVEGAKPGQAEKLIAQEAHE